MSDGSLCSTCPKREKCEILLIAPHTQASICHHYLPALLEEVERIKTELARERELNTAHAKTYDETLRAKDAEIERLSKRPEFESRSGVALIAAARKRQVDEKGFSASHDDEHTKGELALAACCYAAPVRCERLAYLEQENERINAENTALKNTIKMTEAKEEIAHNLHNLIVYGLKHR